MGAIMVVFRGQTGSIGGHRGKCIRASDNGALFDFDEFGKVDFVSNMGRNKLITVELYSEYGRYFCSTRTCGGFKSWISSSGVVTVHEPVDDPIKVTEARVEVSPDSALINEAVYVSVTGTEGATAILYKKTCVTNTTTHIGSSKIVSGVALFIRSFEEDVILSATVDGKKTVNSVKFTIASESGYETPPDEEEQGQESSFWTPTVMIEPLTVHKGEYINITFLADADRNYNIFRAVGMRDVLPFNDKLLYGGKTSDEGKQTKKLRLHTSASIYGKAKYIAGTGQVTPVVDVTVINPDTGEIIEEGEAGATVGGIGDITALVSKMLPIVLIIYIIQMFKGFIPIGQAYTKKRLK